MFRRMTILAALLGVAVTAFAADDIPLLGTWSVTITPTSPPQGFPPSFLALETYSAGGGMVTSNGLPSVPRPGQGVWAKDGSSYRVSITFQGVDLGMPAAGVAVIDHAFTVSANERYTGAGVARFYDSAGNLLFAINFTSEGRRMKLP